MVSGDVQVVKTPPSSEHWKVAVSFAPKPNVAVCWLLGLEGPDPSVVSGAVVSGITVFMIHV